MEYVRNNLLPGIKTPPRFESKIVLLSILVFAMVSLATGGLTGLFVFRVIQFKTELLILPFTMFVFPAFLEEAFFRGILIPNASLDKPFASAAGYTLLSSVLFTLWHPFNACLFNPSAQTFFFDIRFLVIVFFLGVTCSVTYIYSRSLWVPVVIHWITILVWVFLLGGHNLVARAIST